jgi:hypothetical protein
VRACHAEASVEDVLQNVLGVARVGHAPANEIAQPGLLPFDHFGDPLVLFEWHRLQAPAQPASPTSPAVAPSA